MSEFSIMIGNALAVRDREIAGFDPGPRIS